MSASFKAVFGMFVLCLCVTVTHADSRRSSYESMSRENQQMQDDLSINPATFWLMDGQALWSRPGVEGAKSCMNCHGEVAVSMKGVAARFPRVVNNKLRTLESQINQCRMRYQRLPSFEHESQPLLSLTALIALQSRGFPIRVSADQEMKQFLEGGQRLYFRRIGQLNLSCAQCHDDRAGQKLGGVTIPQGHPTGYPIYRIEWQSVGSLQRRLRNCMSGVRAERFAFGSEELNMLESYLMVRAAGMTIESPGVRP